MTAHILIVEDEAALAENLRYWLEADGFRVSHELTGDGADVRIQDEMPDLVILDWMLPGLSGIELCRRIRQRVATRSMPVIMLTARGEEGDRVRGLTTGADDYIVKSGLMKELVARVRALLRRVRPEALANVLSIGDLSLDRDTKRVSRSGAEIHLGPTEFRMLEFLMLNPGRVYSRERLLDNVWGRDVYIDERTVDVHVGRLRKALDIAGQPDPIRTVRGAGYALDEKYRGGNAA
jgi:two-component system, OmpR family, phosphate regulon response regulator PhoB